MITIRDLRIDPTSLGSKMILVDVIPIYLYKDKVRTDTISGHRYIVALPAHAFEKIGIKIDGKRLMEKPENFVEVEFNNLEISTYEAQGKTQLTAKATGINAVKRG